jgi:hypothetical protein
MAPPPNHFLLPKPWIRYFTIQCCPGKILGSIAKDASRLRRQRKDRKGEQNCF